MATFSERYGFKQVGLEVQKDDMDGDLRLDLWNVTYALMFETERRADSAPTVYRQLWTGLLRQSLDQLPYLISTIGDKVKGLALGGDFYNVCDLIELAVGYRPAASEAFNFILSRHNFAYRIADGRLVPITSSDELDEVRRALTGDEPAFTAAREHLAKATAHLSDRQEPDYANSVKESVTALESAVRVVAEGRGDFGANATEAARRLGIHPAIAVAWIKVYGYASDEHGVRHGSTVPPKVTEAEARYILISVSAALNLLVAAGTAGAS